MTTASAIIKFDLLTDKTGSPYFTSDEKLEFLNMAQQEFLNGLFPDSLGGVLNVEADQNVLETIRPLVYPTGGTTASTGRLLYTAINSDLVTQSGDAAAKLFRILNVSFNDTPVKFVKYNDINKFMENSFKVPSSTSLIYTVDALALQVYPAAAVTIDVVAIKTPKLMTAANSPDWDDYVMNQVILKAVELAGVAIRDPELIQSTVNSGVKSAQ